MDKEETPSFQKESDPELIDKYDDDDDDILSDEDEDIQDDEDMPPKRLNLNIADSEDKLNTKNKNIPKYAVHHHVPQDSSKNVTGEPISPALTDIVIDNTVYRRENFLNKSFVRKCCRGFRVQIAAILSIFDFWCNIFVIFMFLLRAYDAYGNHFEFYIWGVIIGIFMVITSIVSYRMGPAESYCNKMYYFCQIGICFECQNSLNHDNYGHATYTFKLINFLESMTRALPLSILKLFILIWYQEEYPYWSAGNWLLIVSITFSIFSYSFWFTSHIKDTLRDKFNDVFESIIPNANKYDGDYNQDPSQSIRKFKMNWFNKIIFCIFIAFDFMTRCGITLVLLRYSPAFIANVHALNYLFLPIFIIIVETCTYFLFLYYLSDLYRNDIKYQYNKLQIFLMIVMAIITITPFYNDCTKMNINYKKKLFVLFFNELLRLIIMSTLMYLLVYYTNFTLSIVQTYVFILFAFIQFGLIIYSTHIIYKCERLTYIAREKTKSASVVLPKTK
eukprot:317848_1